ncbi:sensor histidine kinase [Bacillus sp. FJAT-49736]|uniref:sensor histidine kinase n=1 Tax=Bacillus sp. FJAT-49736 TaxID=2833582 RepID=UPI001BC98C47|nr:sensor histidine kinase [Bacillus sp. FJAT-49736]MBS4174687.1 sensor histidine kinase [Bacillus sp. FJAT-49736]
MELWMIFSKLIVMGYIAAAYVQSGSPHLPWIVFSLLIYFCVNIVIYIFKRDKLKQLFMVAAIVLTIMFCIRIDPLFILLIPINLFELAANYIEKKIFLLILAVIPILYIKANIYPVYGMVTLLSFMIFGMSVMFSKKLMNYENQVDKMRKDLQKLSRNLNENQEYIRQSEYTFKLEERNRLSQEIHDKIGHSMTGALIQMEASKRLMYVDQKKASKLLQNAINISKEGIESIRITLKNMKPSTEQMGIHRMKLLFDEYASKHGLTASFVYKGNLEVITPIHWKIIQENITEALTNTLKYSDATHVSIHLNVLNKVIRAEVRDNGRGAEKVKKGLGIRGMEERTAAINGKVIVDGTNGFSVTTLLPI